MALARIITRSQACSRELAVDLLARGYAVEIVSPDAIPDNIADLELRVDAGPGDQLIANVATHTGERSASLDFVHHLKAPMVDFKRREPRPLETAHALHTPDAPTNFNPQPGVDEVRQPAETWQLALRTVPAAEIHPEPDFKASTSRIEPPLHFEAESPMTGPAKTEAMTAEPTSAESTSAESTITESAIARPAIAGSTIRAALQSLLRGRAAGFFWPALTLVGVIALALVLEFGIRPAGKDSGRLLNDAAKDDAAKDPGLTQALAASPPAAGNLDYAPKPSQPDSAGSSSAMVANAKPAIPQPATATAANPKPADPKPADLRHATAGRKATSSGRGGNDIIARDTVNYLDKRYQQQAAKKPASKAKSAQPLARQHRTPRRHRDGVVAANKVTYQKRDAAAKAAQQESLNKESSDLE